MSAASPSPIKILSDPHGSSGSTGEPMLHVFKKHWPHYIAEAAGLMAFMLGAGAFTTLFLHPGSPVQQALPSELLIPRI